MKRRFFTLALSIISTILIAQTGSISGKITSENEMLPFVNIQIENTDFGATSDENGFYKIENIPFGQQVLTVSFLGFETLEKTVLLDANKPNQTIDFNLIPSRFELNRIVVTGTKTFKRQIESSVIVNVIGSCLLYTSDAADE